MILLIDNYDSFSYNLYQLVGELEPEIRVIRNDEMTVDQIRALRPDRILLSPGPGRPEDAGVTMEAAGILGKEIPTLGVCLGHQAICAAFGATVTYAKALMHGKQSVVRFDPTCPLFRGLPEAAPVARYHSLAAEAVGRPVRPDVPLVPRPAGGGPGGTVPLPGRGRGHRPRLPENHRPDSGRRSDGGAAQGISHFRRTVPSGIHSDPGRKNHTCKLFTEGDLSHDQGSHCKNR